MIKIKFSSIEFKNIYKSFFSTGISGYMDRSSIHPFNELCKLAKCHLVLPWSNRGVERCF